MSHQAVSIHLAKQADQHRWNTYVRSHPDGSPYHLFAWKQAVEQAYGHRSYYFYAESGGRLTGILPLFHLYFPGILNELTALPYCDVGNCLCDSDAVQDALLAEALKLQKTLRSRKLNLRGPLRETELKNKKFYAEATRKVRMLLELPTSSEELFLSFKSKLRSQIRKAEKNGIAYRWVGLEEMDSIYSVFSKNMHELGSPVHAKRWLRSVLENYKNNARVGLATFEGKAVGMAVILLNGSRASIPWASTLRDFNHLSPNMLLYWNVLQYSADNGCKLFDFGRSTEGAGTYNFKKQWGTQPVPLQWYTAFSSRGRGKVQERPRQFDIKNFIADIWKKLPLPFANFMGPRLRKYISL